MLKINASEQDIWDSLARLSSHLDYRGNIERVLAFGPSAKANTYQSLLYCSSSSHGYHLLPVAKAAQLELMPTMLNTVVHFHWLNEFLQGAATPVDAANALDRVRRMLDGIDARGHQLVWTVHNVISHVCQWEEHEVALCQLMADRADVIHVMSSTTIDDCAPWYALDKAKVIQIPHPSYLGGQAEWVERNAARKSIGIPRDAFVFLLFGAVLPYKGYETVMKVFDEVCATALGRTIYLLIAGPHTDQSLSAKVLAWGALRQNVVVDLGRKSSDELQFFYKSADAALCPYARSLNSGAAMMAMSFGIPVVAPRMGSFIDDIPPGGGVLYEASEGEAALSAAMKECLTKDLKHMREQCLAVVQRRAPRVMSDLFFKSLNHALTRHGTPNPQEFA